VIVELPDNSWFLVFDDAAIDAGEPVVTPWSHDKVREEGRRGEVAWVADTVRGLALKAGIDPDALEQTVREWNEIVRSGHDPLGRARPAFPIDSPPYYALRNRATTFISFGGLPIDTELRVLDEQNRPIPGLYAAGEIVGAGATSGNAFCSGMLVTPALSFGRLLGRRLAGVRAAVRAAG
jgi:succinate dehydrogenase/fumarate reductase flavoprotein subunit